MHHKQPNRSMINSVLFQVEIDQLIEKEHIDLLSISDGELQIPYVK